MAGAGTGHLSRLTKNPLQYSRFVLLQQLHLLMATFHMFERFSKQGVKGWCSQSYVIVKLSASGESGALMLLLLNLTLCGIILSERGYALNYHSPVFETDGALGARCTHFRRCAHIFSTCVPGVHTIFHPIIIALHKGSAQEKSWVHSLKICAPEGCTK